MPAKTLPKKSTKMKLVAAFDKPFCEKCQLCHLRPVDAACTRVSPQAKLAQLLQQHPLDELIRRGLLFDARGAAKKTGYAPAYIRRLCEAKRMEHVRREVGTAHQYFFLPEQLDAVWSHVPKVRA